MLPNLPPDTEDGGEPVEVKRKKSDDDQQGPNVVPSSQEAVTSDDFEMVAGQPIRLFILEVVKHYLTQFKEYFVSFTGNSGRIVWAAVTVLSSFIFFLYFNKNQSNSVENVTQATIESGVYDALRSSEFEDQLREMQLEEQREEEEAERRRKARREKARMELELTVSQMDEETLLVDKRSEMDRQESDMKFEKMRNEYQVSNMFKDKLSQLEMDLKEAKRRAEQEQSENRLRELRRKNEKKIGDLNEEIERKRGEFREEEARQEMEIKWENERIEKRLEELQEQLAKNLEEMHRRDAQRRAEMEHQLREIYRNLRNKAWNEIIENNWTRRLNALRAANQHVSIVYKSLKVKDHSTNRQLLGAHLQSFLAAVKSEQQLMEKESREMDRMYSETGKPFLLDIKKAVELVAAKCELFSSVLRSTDVSIRRVDKCYQDLCQASTSIPTLGELKNRYYESMRDGSSS